MKKTYIPKKCHNCNKPFNCTNCLYRLCKKPVDEALIDYKYKKLYKNEVTIFECVEWYIEYFKFNLE